MLLELAKKQPNVLKEPEPKVVMQSFGDFSLNLMLHVWIYSHKDKVEVINRINRNIDENFKNKGIEIPFPIRTVYLKDKE